MLISAMGVTGSSGFFTPGSNPTDSLNMPRANDDGERRILRALARIQSGESFRNVSIADGRVLRQYVEIMNAMNVVEIGTSTGKSAIGMALGLRRTGGKLWTHEIETEQARVAQARWKPCYIVCIRP